MSYRTLVYTSLFLVFLLSYYTFFFMSNRTSPFHHGLHLGSGGTMIRTSQPMTTDNTNSSDTHRHLLHLLGSPTTRQW